MNPSRLAQSTLLAVLGIALLAGFTAPVRAGQKLVILLDDSSSMLNPMRSGKRRIDVAKQALLKVLEQLPDDAQAGLLLLNGKGGSRWAIPLSPVDKSNLRQSVERITANGGTPLGTYMKEAADRLLELREKERYGTYKLLIVTDGEATDGRRLDQYLPDILARGIVVDVIGVDMKQDHSLATKVDTYRRADDPAGLEKALTESVLGESVADDSAAGESDYELLAGFPDEVAAAALQALTKVRNEPIGQPHAAPADEDAAASGSAASASGASHPVAVPAQSGQADGLAVTAVLIMLVMVLGGLGLAVFVFVALKAR